MSIDPTGSPALDRMVERLASTSDPRRRYEYVLWLAKRLEPLPDGEEPEGVDLGRGVENDRLVHDSSLLG